MSFAKSTSVPVVRSQEEIRRTLEKYGATGFMFGESGGRALCAFEAKNRRIKFLIDLPVEGKTRDEKKRYLLSRNECDQRTRTAWRCLLLAIKAKMECAESGISTFEQEFMAHIVMPNGQTVGEVLIPQIGEAYDSGKMPPLLLGGRT